MEQCTNAAFGLLADCGLAVRRRPEATVLTTPVEFESLFPATGGALYGQAVHGTMAAFRRPGSRSAIPRLYLAGGSVHPGRACRWRCSRAGSPRRACYRT